MRRRCFMDACLLLAGTPARAQVQRRQHRLAFVHSGIPADQLTEAAGPYWVRRFFGALRSFGHAEGSNLVVDRYSAEGQLDRFPELARSVVQGSPDVIVTNLNALASAFREVTQTIPIVAIVGDPLRSGLVDSLARPGGNITGVSIDAGFEIYGKQLQILKETVPVVTKIAFLASAVWWNSAPGADM